jgi:hypothetical protein
MRASNTIRSGFRGLGVTALLGLAVAATACSIPKTDFRATPDGGGGGDDQPSVLSIVASPNAVVVDEGATKDFTVALSQAPSAPLTVSVATMATTKLAISVPTLAFTPTNFDQPQTVTVTGLADRDTADEHAEITLTAAGVDPVTVSTTVHDLDTLQIIASGSNPLVIDEGSQVVVNVHLSAPPAGDLSVTAVLGNGPVTVTPATRVFTSTNFDADQTFTFKAVADADTVDDTVTLTFRATNVPDKMVTIEDRDTSIQGLHVDVSPADATITEQTTTATLDVALNQKPSQSVTVTVATTGQAHTATTQLTFTPTNYATTQRVTVDAPDDPDTVDGSGTVTLSATDPDKGTSLNRAIVLTVKDNDVQKILTDAPSPLLLTETAPASFNATLAFKPTANVIVGVSSMDTLVATASPGSLTFTPTDYNLPHAVTVTGKHDGNLVTDRTAIRLTESSIGPTDVQVSVADVDHQAIKFSTSALSIPEGAARTFDVSLMFDPGASGATVDLADDNINSFSISRASIPFTSANFATPVTVTVNAILDHNNVVESAMITGTGAGAMTPATLTATVVEATVIKSYGFPTPFTSDAASLGLGEMIAYKFATDVNTTLDSFGVYISAGSGNYRMAIYADGLNGPGSLVASMPGPQPFVDGINIGNITDVSLPVGTYWVAFRGAQATSVGLSTLTTQIGPECVAVANISDIMAPWPSDFGPKNCGTDFFMNFFITTYHQ